MLTAVTMMIAAIIMVMSAARRKGQAVREVRCSIRIERQLGGSMVVCKLEVRWRVDEDKFEESVQHQIY